jgi:hypothetical protein
MPPRLYSICCIVNLKIRTIDLNFSANNYKEYIDEIMERLGHLDG